MGSDFDDYKRLSRGKIFQSTLPHGERHAPWTRSARHRNFNPRSRMGSDVHLRELHPGITISIHAPAWGATICSFVYKLEPVYFNPRSRMGSDILIEQSISLGKAFQSTLPHGERPTFGASAGGSYEFQSTLPHGERRLRFLTFTAPFVFQSTLPHGERHNTHNDRDRQI